MALVCEAPLNKGPLRGVLSATGTNAGYARHQVAGDLPACAPCREAKSTRGRLSYQENPYESRLYSRDKVRRRTAADPEANRIRLRQAKLRKYGMSQRLYEDLLISQGGGCAICGVDNPAPQEHFDIDHDHECCSGGTSCGRCVRGLLCRKCNAGLGLFGDDAEKVAAAAAYLKGRS